MNLSQVFGCSFIYSLCDPDTGECRYVGKANDPKRRWQTHISSALNPNSRTYNTHAGRWIRVLRSVDKFPKLQIIEWVSQDSWQHRECYWIGFFEYIGCRITNSTAGGYGGRRPGWKMSDEHKAALSRFRTGRKFGPRGPFSEKARESIRQGLIKAGVRPSPLAYERSMAAIKGKPAWNAGKKMSPETCAKLSAMRIGNTYTLGHKNSPEVVERKRQAQIRRWSRWREQRDAHGL